MQSVSTVAASGRQVTVVKNSASGEYRLYGATGTPTGTAERVSVDGRTLQFDAQGLDIDYLALTPAQRDAQTRGIAEALRLNNARGGV